MSEPILRIDDLSAEYVTPDGLVKAVRHISLDLYHGRTLAVMGESGSGKTSVGLCILDLLPHPGRISGGRILYGGRDLLALPGEEMRAIRGREIAMVFQDPSTGLNPVLSVGQQVEEAITSHVALPRGEARRRSVEALAQVGLPDPEEAARRYPFQLSGGMAQRVMIAIATALGPSALILDEPTSALDVTVQAGILEDLRTLQKRQGTAILLITHDLGVVAQMAHDVAVMYAGFVAEQGETVPVFERPRHPYTWSLLGSRPRLDRDGGERLPAIKGTPPSLVDLPDRCPFLPRCPKAINDCRELPAPPLREMEPRQEAACYNPVYQQAVA